MITRNQVFCTTSSNQPSVPFVLNYSFDYDCFKNSDLKSRAKSALGSFFGFMGATLDGLLGVGRMLRELYNDCVASLQDGKKVFDSWISSEDFGASQYLAKSSMEIAGWFDGLQPIRQESIRSKVQRWSVSALVQLSKVAEKFLEEVINGGKKTAAQVKQAVQSLAPSSTKKAPTQSNPTAQSPKIVTKGNSKSERLFTTDEVEQEVQKRLEAYKNETKEEMIGKAFEAEESGKKAAGATLKSYEQRLQALEKNKQELLQKLDVKEQELAAVPSLQVRNQELEQRVADLEKVIESSNQSNTPAPLRKFEEKVSPNFVLLLVVLMAEVKDLKSIISSQNQELAQRIAYSASREAVSTVEVVQTAEEVATTPNSTPIGIESEQASQPTTGELSAEEIAVLLCNCKTWEEIVTITDALDKTTRTESWLQLSREEQARILELKKVASIEVVPNNSIEETPIIKVGDTVIWTNCWPHLSSWNPFIVQNIEDDYAKLNNLKTPVPLEELSLV